MTCVDPKPEGGSMSKQREAFEAWVKSKYPEAPLHHRGGKYLVYAMNWRWEAWQASRAAALEEAKTAAIACELGGLSVGDAVEGIRALKEQS